jgi:hypothetical protein
VPRPSVALANSTLTALELPRIPVPALKVNPQEVALRNALQKTGGLVKS